MSTLELCIVLYNFASLDVNEASLMMFFFLLFLKYIRVCDTLCSHSYAFTLCLNASAHRLNMALDLQSLFGLHVQSCTHWLSPPPHLVSDTRALLVNGHPWYTTYLCDSLVRLFYQIGSSAVLAKSCNGLHSWVVMALS
jgi:hypothetical protein